MSSVSYLSGWNPELCIQLEDEDRRLADFNRLLVKGFPSTKQLKRGGQFKTVEHEDFVLLLVECFHEKLKEGISHDSLHTTFHKTSQYLRWCEKEDAEAFTKSSIEGYMAHEKMRAMLGEIKQSPYGSTRSKLLVTFTEYLALPSHYFDSVVVLSNNDSEPFEAYTRSDLNQLLPFLRQLFNQTYQQFVVEPDKHLNAPVRIPAMTFSYKGQSYQIYGGISKMMCAATYLLAYYTYTNTGELFKLKRPTAASTSISEIWYTMPAFRRRAFKSIQVEMGGHGLIDVPKYSISFFDKLLHASTLISSDENALLLQTVVNKKPQRIKTVTLQDSLLKWIEKYFNFRDQTKRRLRPMISRFRETGSQLTAYHQGEMTNDIMLNNTPNTRKQHYSQGNKHINNGMLQDVMVIRQEQIKSGVSPKIAQENLGIEMLVIESEYKVNIPDLSRTASGSSCANPFGEQSKMYTKKAQKQRLLKEGERLACADLLKCFGCKEQVIVQSVNDIWCLLSFKASIEESLYLHLDTHHYHKNFETVVTFINTNILPKLKKSILKQAETKLDDKGYHPLWDDSKSILGLIPNSTNKGPQ
ncbi:hypothetical protein [Vibrio tapetis]|uniref:Uncharacterized protein n=1 Tax=Vibrio tapetis subsp. tapetis TaxID=1671868 RepID=A0A2N8ZGU4_9VIBR|nr:hypothetical protein [Vibrio tapetis]SON51132.1 conserved protein of unknown function [Vibrio tapetis subsp. tapetis]